MHRSPDPMGTLPPPPLEMTHARNGISHIGGVHVKTLEARPISTIFAQIEAVTIDIRETVVQSMDLLTFRRGPTHHPSPADAADQAVLKGIGLLKQLREFRSALREVKSIRR
jgi:hypothetical protein